LPISPGAWCGAWDRPRAKATGRRLAGDPGGAIGYARRMPRSLIAIVALCLWPMLAAAGTLAPETAKTRADQGELTVIDVRLPQEWAQTGLPEGAKGVSLQNPATFEVRPGFVADVLRAVDGNRERPIALICARGNRSAFARDLLERAGFANVHDISEGMIGGENGPGWLARDLPIEPCAVC